MYIYVRRAPGHHGHQSGVLGELGRAERLRSVKDSTRAPYRWICALDVHFPARPDISAPVRRTGVLISPRHVLTAARNLTRLYAGKTIEQMLTGDRVEARMITVTPGLDGSRSKKKRAPIGSVDLKPGEWWIPPQYRQSGDFGWDLAVLTLPRELPAFNGMTYGHWSDARYSPRTTIAAVAAESLAGSTLTLAGYPAGWCFNPQRPEDSVTGVNPSAQSETYGKGRPTQPELSAKHRLMVHDVPTCVGMDGAPMWINAGGLRLVAIQTGPEFRHLNPVVEEKLGTALPLRQEIVDTLRQRILLDRIRPTF